LIASFLRPSTFLRRIASKSSRITKIPIATNTVAEKKLLIVFSSE
jgi:hypothetical protein